MPISRILPARLKAILRPPIDWCRGRLPSAGHRHTSLAKTHAYWRRPWDGANSPANYLRRDDRSRFLLGLVRKYVEPDARVLEIGCNVGRNLHCLHAGGFRNLTAVEINPDALALLAASYPELARDASLVNAPIESAIRDFRDGQFDLTFTMAVLEHVHTESEWIFAEIARITRQWLITIEDEQGRSWRHFPRDYRTVFGKLGMTQVEEIRFGENDVFSPGFCTRVFRHA